MGITGSSDTCRPNRRLGRLPNPEEWCRHCCRGPVGVRGLGFAHQYGFSGRKRNYCRATWRGFLCPSTVLLFFSDLFKLINFHCRTYFMYNYKQFLKTRWSVRHDWLCVWVHATWEPTGLIDICPLVLVPSPEGSLQMLVFYPNRLKVLVSRCVVGLRRYLFIYLFICMCVLINPLTVFKHSSSAVHIHIAGHR